MAGKSTEYKLAIKIAGAVSSSFNSAMGSASSALSGIGSAAATAAKAAGVAIGAATTAMAAFAKSAVEAGMEFDSSMSQVAATMGVSTDEITDLRDLAIEMGSKTAFSATEAADGLNILAMAGLNAAEQTAALPNVLNVAAAGALSLDEAATYVTGAVKAFSDEMENSQYYADLMAKGATLANTDVSALGEAIVSGGATAASYGQSVDSMTLSLLRLAEQNVTGAEAATALNRAMADIYTPTAASANALAELGIAVYDSSGHARDFNDVVADISGALSGMSDEEANAYKSTIFTTRGLSAFNKIATTSEESLQKFTEGLSNVDGSALAQAATQLDNLKGDITLWNSSLETAKITLSDQLTPTLRQFVQFGTEGLSKVTDAFREGGLAGAMEAFGGVLSDGLDMIVDYLPTAIDAGMQLLGALGQGILDNLPTIANAAVEIVVMLVGGIAQAAPAVIQAVMDLGLQLLETLTSPEFLTNILQAALDIILGLANGLIQAIPRLVEAIPTIIENLIQAIIAAIPMLIEAGVQLLVSLVANLPAIIVGIVKAIPQIIVAIIKGFGQLGSMLADLFSKAWDGIKNIFSGVGDFFSGVWSGIKGAFSSVGGWFKDKFTQANENTKAAWSAVGGWFSSRWQDIKGAFSSVGGWFKDKFAEAWENIKTVFSAVGGFFKGIWETITGIFTKIGTTIGNGISGAFKTVVNAIISFAEKTINGFINAINGAIGLINKIPGVNIGLIKTLEIPRMAEGGVVTAPTFLEAGEAGTEAIIPLSELWTQMQDLMADAIAAPADWISDALAALTGGRGDDGAEPGEDFPPIYITYSPVYNFEGEAPTKEDLEEAEKLSQAEFNRMAQQWLKDIQRSRF